jgi:hypothetical protein
MEKKKLRPISDKVIVESGMDAELVFGELPATQPEQQAQKLADRMKGLDLPRTWMTDPAPGAEELTVNEILAIQYVDMGEKIKTLEDERRKLRNELELEAAKNGGELVAGAFTVKTVVSYRSSLSKEKLLEQGVTISQLEAATEKSPYSTLTVRKKK